MCNDPIDRQKIISVSNRCEFMHALTVHRQNADRNNKAICLLHDPLLRFPFFKIYSTSRKGHGPIPVKSRIQEGQGMVYKVPKLFFKVAIPFLSETRDLTRIDAATSRLNLEYITTSPHRRLKNVCISLLFISMYFRRLVLELYQRIQQFEIIEDTVSVFRKEENN